MDTPKTPSKSIIAIIVIVLLVAAAGVVIAINMKDSERTTVSDSNTTQTSPAETSGEGTNNATASTG
ncbi:hypothetical protein HY312_00820, partial [Candidatus Saccharibacteria bacterium]|nr:hypothetical protein [Candidatus Saccharibacteria bacterium]